MSTALTSRDIDPNGMESLREDDDASVVPADRLVELLGDDYTRRVLETIADEAMGGREIAEATAISRPTVYRRLNQLEEAGLIETTMVLCADGHHHKQYRAVLEAVNFRLGRDGLQARVRVEDARPEQRVGAD